MFEASKGEFKFELAPQDAVTALGPYVDQVLEAVGHPEALVTDESTLGDFLSGLDFDSTASTSAIDAAEQRWLKKVASRLGLDSVAATDYIWEVARRLMLGE